MFHIKIVDFPPFSFWQFNCRIFNSSTRVYLGQTDHSCWPWS